jgi:hypothetical protein
LRKRNLTLSLACLACLLLALGGCAKQKPAFEPSSSVSIGIGGFSQPQNTRQLLAGYMPEEVEILDQKIFPLLDQDLEDLLREHTDREYVGSGVAYQCMNKHRAPDYVSAFSFWLDVGRCMKVDLLLVPQVQGWRERQGGDLGVETPAAVTLDFFLLDVNNQALIARSRYDEAQAALASNLLNLGKFFSRGGKWVTANELAREGIIKAIKEFGL